MPEGRVIRRSLTRSKKFRRLDSDASRVLYFAMLLYADRDGRVSNDPDDLLLELQIGGLLSHDQVVTGSRSGRDSGLLVELSDCYQLTGWKRPKTYPREAESRFAAEGVTTRSRPGHDQVTPRARARG